MSHEVINFTDKIAMEWINMQYLNDMGMRFWNMDKMADILLMTISKIHFLEINVTYFLVKKVLDVNFQIGHSQ